MQLFKEFLIQKNIEDISGLSFDEFYEVAMYLARKNALSEEQIYNELLGGIGQAIGNGVNAVGQAVKSGIQSFGQNVSNNFQQGQQRNQVMQTTRKITDLQGDLKKVGLTDPKVQNFLTNVGRALQAGNGKQLSFNGQTYKANATQPGQQPDYNAALQGMRNMVRQGRAVQPGDGSGI
jgi:hypothetical protein